ncbi:MAG: MBL fold metallo-hydrolase [Planctomycetaceae bacterium]|nr:MBL fold metallo-hydrolase [Planctomycetaceae bacterium]
MIKPMLAGDSLLADIQAAESSEAFFVWWLGQSGFLVKWQRHYLLFDPYLSDSLTKKYAATDKPHVRMTELAIEPSRLGFVEVATSSHNHTDHLDADTLKPLMAANADLEIVVPAANRGFAADRLGVEPSRLRAIDAGQEYTSGPFQLSAVPAAHETVERDEQDRCKFIGLVARFGPWSIYHSGDTMLYEGMEETLQPFAVDLAILPINGRAPERRVAGNLWGREAAQLAETIGARHVVPCHYDMFEFNTESPDEFVATCQQRDQSFDLLQCGQRWCSDSIR